MKLTQRQERVLWREAKSQAPRGALVLLDIGNTLITFDNDARRAAKALKFAECKHLRFSKQAQGNLIERFNSCIRGSVQIYACRTTIALRLAAGNRKEVTP